MGKQTEGQATERNVQGLDALGVLARLIDEQRAAWGIPDDDLAAARAAVVRLVSAASDAEAFIGVMFGTADGRMPDSVQTPLGIPVKVGEIASDLRAALAPFQTGAAP